MDRVRGGFDRAMFASSPRPASSRLRADGFSWADCTIVFEQLGRFCVPGPLVASLLLGDGRIVGFVDESTPTTSICESSTSTCSTISSWARHGAMRHVDPTTLARRTVAVAARSAHTGRACARSSRPGAAIDADVGGAARPRARCSPPRCSSGSPTGCTELAVDYAKERVQFDRPIGGVPGDQAPARRHARAHRGRRAPRCTRPARTSTTRTSPGIDRAIAGAKVARRRGRDRERQDGDAGVRRHGLHVGGRRAPLPEAGVGARHPLRLERRARAMPSRAAATRPRT